MITPSDIVKHLKTYLPLFTSLFTEALTVSSATISAGNVLTVNSTGHGRSPGQNIVITGGTVRNPLNTSALIGSTVQFTTDYDHDLIRPSLPNDDQTLSLGGFGNVWDGEHDIIDVPNRQNFTINLPTGEVAAPPVDGSQYLIEALLTGVYQVDTVPDADSFTVNLSDSPLIPLGTVDNLTIMNGFRIAAAADFNRAKAAYSKQGIDEPYLFVIMTDTDVSKDRHTMNDGVAGVTRQNEMLLRLLQSFSTSVFIPTTTDLSGADAQDLAYGELFTALISSLFGVGFEGSKIKYVNVPSGMGPGEYNSAYYVHVYDWQLPFVINFENGFLEIDDVAFRDISQTLKLFADDQAAMTTNIDLDETEL